MVYLVSTFHDPSSSILTTRKRPRINQTNKKHVQLVWGDNYEVEVHIPECVDTYNNKKVGVDGADQLIASYGPKVRFKRTWMPQASHAHNCIRVNSYVVHKHVCTHPITAKENILDWNQWRPTPFSMSICSSTPELNCVNE